jgi:hypothetical protein
MLSRHGFTFHLEAHFVAEAVADVSNGDTNPFPLDSALYKGSFQLKKGGGSRYQTIVEHQVVMKFRRNAQGSFNVHGKGMNGIGEFHLLGTMVMSGKTAGQVELYRIYPPEKLLAAPSPKPIATPEISVKGPGGPSLGSGATGTASAPLAIPRPSSTALQRRESTRSIKLPSRLEEDDPSAQLLRVMEKCAQILRSIREHDVELGAFFPILLIRSHLESRHITRLSNTQWT